MYALLQKYKKLFEANDPAKGGSFYLQSKIFRSKEVLDRELDGTNKAEAEAEAATNAESSTNNETKTEATGTDSKKDSSK